MGSFINMDAENKVSDALSKADIEIGECTHPAGHCYGNDGGHGIPEHLKVAPGRGGEFLVVETASDKVTVLDESYYNRCQYCQKFDFVQTKQQRDEKRQKETI